jgi:amidohydrolase
MLLIALLLAAPSSAVTPDAAIKAEVLGLGPRLVETRRDIHRHPEPSNAEERTGKLVADQLRAAGLSVRHPVARTGVVAVLQGGRPDPVVAVRADLDALPIQEKRDSPYKSENPGVMHACGHDAHTTIVLGTALVLAHLRARLPGTVVFLFQPAEEGTPDGEEGGARLMMKEGALDEPKVRAIYGLHMDPLLDVGTVGWAVGPIWASSDRFAIEVKGQRTHGAAPHTGLDPIPVAAEIVSALQTIASRQIDAQNPKVLTIGSIHGGNRFNIVAGDVKMEGTLRTLDASVRRDVKERMARTVNGVAEAHGTTAALTFVGDGNPVTLNDAAHTRASLPSLVRVYGADHVLEVKPQMPTEDYAFFAEKVPGLYLKMGVRNRERGITAMIHTEEFDIDEAVLPLGVRAMCTLVWDYLARTPKYISSEVR